MISVAISGGSKCRFSRLIVLRSFLEMSQRFLPIFHSSCPTGICCSKPLALVGHTGRSLLPVDSISSRKSSWSRVCEFCRSALPDIPSRQATAKSRWGVPFQSLVSHVSSKEFDGSTYRVLIRVSEFGRIY